jgi:hypothetical protein
MNTTFDGYEQDSPMSPSNLNKRYSQSDDLSSVIFNKNKIRDFLLSQVMIPNSNLKVFGRHCICFG